MFLLYLSHIEVVRLRCIGGPLEIKEDNSFLSSYLSPPSGLLSQKDRCPSIIFPDLIDRLLPHRQPISRLCPRPTRSETIPVRSSNSSGVKYFTTNVPTDISVSFETKSHSLLIERVLLISFCTCWMLEAGVVSVCHSAAGAWRRYTLICVSGDVPWCHEQVFLLGV